MLQRSAVGGQRLGELLPLHIVEHLPAQIALKFEGDDEIRWWHLWWQVETLFGARRFAAKILLPNGWRYCICQMAGEPQQQDNRGYWLHIVLSVQILAEFEEEIA